MEPSLLLYPPVLPWITAESWCWIIQSTTLSLQHEHPLFLLPDFPTHTCHSQQSLDKIGKGCVEETKSQGLDSLSLSISLSLSLHRHLQWAVIWQRRECSYVASSEVPLNTRLTVRSQCLMHLQKGLPASIMWDHVISRVAMADFSISFPAFHIFWLVVSTYPSEKWWSE